MEGKTLHKITEQNEGWSMIPNRTGALMRKLLRKPAKVEIVVSLVLIISFLIEESEKNLKQNPFPEQYKLKPSIIRIKKRISSELLVECCWNMRFE